MIILSLWLQKHITGLVACRGCADGCTDFILAAAEIQCKYNRERLP